MDPNAFALFQLPTTIKLSVLQNLDLIDLLNMSLISTKSKVLVKSLSYKATNYEVVFMDDGIRSTIRFEKISPFHAKFPTENQAYFKYEKMIKTPANMYACSHCWNDKTSHGWNRRNWIDHLMYIFNCNGICLLFESSRFSVESIRELVRGIPMEKLCTIGIDDEKIVLERFANESKRLEVTTNIALNISMGNFDSFKIGKQRIPYSLDDSLLMNSVVLDISFLTMNDFLRFAKLWMKGCCPRLKYMRSTVREQPNDPLNFMECLRTIKNTKNRGPILYQIPNTDHSKNYVKTVRLPGGCDIMQRNGVIATVGIQTEMIPHVNGAVFNTIIHMIVWY